MRQYERSGVTVDQCTECRGIFLDRGELDRLIDVEDAWHRGSAPPVAASPPQPPPQQQPPPPQRYRDYDSDEYPMYGHSGHGKRKKKRSFLSEMFD